MRVESTEAIVLRCRPFRETSTLADLLSRDRGLIRVVARGNLRPRSSLHGRLRVFSRGQAEYLPGRGNGDLFLLRSFQPHPGSERTLASLEDAALLYYCGELVSAASGGAEEGGRLFALFESLLQCTVSQATPREAGLWFELNWLASLGLLPSLDRCTDCQAPLSGPAFSPTGAEGLFCRRCRPRAGGQVINAGVLSVLRRLTGTPPSRITSLRISPAQAAAARRLARSLIDTAIGKPIQSRRFFDSTLARGSRAGKREAL